MVYMVKIMGMDEFVFFVFFGVFLVLVYGFVVIGGWIGDKVIGIKCVIIFGVIVMMVGYVLFGFFIVDYLFVGLMLIYIVMGFIMVGNGLFKVNFLSLFVKIYLENDFCLDGVFIMYYMVINLGFFFLMIIILFVVIKMGYGMVFGVSVVGFVIIVVNFLFCLCMLKGIGFLVDFMLVNKMYLVFVVVGFIIVSLVCSYLL